METEFYQNADGPEGDASASRPRPSSSEGVSPERVIGGYRLLEPMGGDAVATLYRGYDASLDRLVAIRILKAEASGDRARVERFQAEASVAAGINHPNVVAIHFVGQEGGVPFYVMHFVVGESLASRLLREERLSPPEAMEYARQCLAGLEAAHQRGIVHGALHPGKILLEESSGRAVLTDLGRFKQAAHDTKTDLASVLYTPPEVARGAAPDARSDLYALGLVLYRMLAGRMPFEADSPADVLYQVTYGTPLPLKEAAPDVPKEIGEIVGRLTARDPDARYPNASEALTEVEAVCREWTEGGAVWAEVVDEFDLETGEALSRSLDRQLDGRPWQRARDWAATMVRRHAPQFLQDLQNTSQQVDGAIAAYQRRCNRLDALLAEGEQIGADLAGAAARAEHEQHLAGLKAELSQASETLSRLRRQRDLLAERLEKVGRQRSAEPRKPSRRFKTLVAVGAILLGLLILQTSVLFVLSVLKCVERQQQAKELSAPKPTEPVSIDLPAAPPADLLSENVAYFTFEPDTIVASGPCLVVKDMSGRGNHGVLIGSSEFGEGQVGQALEFPQSGQRIDLPTLESMAGNTTHRPFSVSVWIRQERYTKWCAIFTGLTRFAENRSITFQGTRKGAKVEARNILAEQWHHVVGVWAGVSTLIYVDGKLADRKPTTSPLDARPEYEAAFSLGSINRYGYHIPSFIGRMDEFALFDRPLFPQEVETLYRQGIERRRPELPAGQVSADDYWSWLDEHRRDDNVQAVTADGKTRLEIGHWGRIWQMDMATGEAYVYPRLATDGASVDRLCFSCDARWAALLGCNSTVPLWDLQEKKIAQEFRTPLVVTYTAALSPDGKRIAIGGKVLAPNQNLAPMAVWDRLTGEVVREFHLPVTEVRALAYSPDGRRLCAVQRRSEESYELEICLLRSDNGQLIRHLSKQRMLGGPHLRWLPDNKRVLYVNGGYNIVRLLDTDLGQDDALFSGEQKIWQVALRADGRVVVGITSENVAVFWDVDGKREVGQIELSESPQGILSAGRDELTLLMDSGLVERFAVPAAIQAALAEADLAVEE